MTNIEAGQSQVGSHPESRISGERYLVFTKLVIGNISSGPLCSSGFILRTHI